MKTLLRSTFAARPDDDSELLYRNVQSLRDSGLSFEGQPEHEAIWKYVQDFVQQHHHVPDLATLQGHFNFLGERTVVDQVEALATIPVKTRGNFLAYMEEQVSIRRTRQVGEILREAAQIVETGLPFKNGREEIILRGPADAIRHVLDRGHEIVMPSTGIRLAGEITTDTENFRAEYDRVESDPLAGIGQFCGIEQIDNAVRGAKRTELWTHAAFTGGLKSTLAINWAYNQAIYYKHSCVYFSLEMSYAQDRRIFYALHSAHDKFKEVRLALGLGKSLSYQRIRDGELDKFPDAMAEKMDPKEREKLLPDARGVKCIHPDRPERRFLMEYVLPDLENPANNYGKIHVEVADPNKSDFTVPDLRSKAELLHSADPDIRTIFVDHMGLMAPRRHHKSTTEDLNEVLRDLKKLAMSFNRGMGIAVVGLFQISREGYKSAEKNDGRYNLTHLSYANEAERSSDIVTASWVDDGLRERSQVRFQCLKSRDNQPFDTFYAGLHWPCRRMFTTYDVTTEDAKKAGEEMDLLPDG